MIDHIGLQVSDFAHSKRFYVAALAPLGYRVLTEFGDDAAGLGVERPDFWLGKGARPTAATHLLRRGRPSRGRRPSTRRRWPRAGGQRRPGLRDAVPPHYYGAFVLDGDGNNVEAVCHQPG